MKERNVQRISAVTLLLQRQRKNINEESGREGGRSMQTHACLLQLFCGREIFLSKDKGLLRNTKWVGLFFHEIFDICKSP
jgi:hypothetical protein